MRILVAEDMEGMRCAVAAALESEGHDVVEAATGREALALLGAEHFDAAVIDLWMPFGDGLSVLRRIRAENKGLRVIVMTGGGPRLPVEAAALIAEVWGAEHVLLKPFDDRELLARLARPPWAHDGGAERFDAHEPD